MLLALSVLLATPAWATGDTGVPEATGIPDDPVEPTDSDDSGDETSTDTAVEDTTPPSAAELAGEEGGFACDSGGAGGFLSMGLFGALLVWRLR